MQKTASEILSDQDISLDCSPRFEAIVGQGYILDIWVYSNAEHVVYGCDVMLNQEADSNSNERHMCWLEDGTARKGEVIEKYHDAFFTMEEALDWMRKTTEAVMIEQFGDLSDESLAV